MISKLGVQGSALGAGTFNLGTAPAAQPAPRLGSAFAVLKSLTAMRLTQVALEASAQVQLPPVNLTQVATEASTQIPPPPVNLTQVAAEASALLPLPPVNLTEVAAEASALLPLPPVNDAQLVMEAVVMAPPTRLGNASVKLALQNITRQGSAWVRILGPHEREREGFASALLAWPAPTSTDQLPNPTKPPIVTVTAGGGTLGVGIYWVGYTWVDQFGETQMGPPVAVMVTAPNSSIQIGFAEPPPDGAIGVRTYISATSDPGVGGVAPAPDGTGGVIGTAPTAKLVRTSTTPLPVGDIKSDFVDINFDTTNTVCVTNWHNNNDPNFEVIEPPADLSFNAAGDYPLFPVPGPEKDSWKDPSIWTGDWDTPVQADGGVGWTNRPLDWGNDANQPLWPESPGYPMEHAVVGAIPERNIPGFSLSFQGESVTFHATFDRPPDPPGSQGYGWVEVVTVAGTRNQPNIAVNGTLATGSKFASLVEHWIAMRAEADDLGTGNVLRVKSGNLLGVTDNPAYFPAWVGFKVRYHFAQLTDEAAVLDPPEEQFSQPDLNTTGDTLPRFDHDYRDPMNKVHLGSLGWRPSSPGWDVLRSGPLVPVLGVLGAPGHQIPRTLSLDGDIDAPDDAAGKHWYDLDYDDAAWLPATGGYQTDDVFHSLDRETIYNPHWPALPTAPTMGLGVPDQDTQGSPDVFVTSFALRHIWTASAGALSHDDGLLTIRYTGVLKDAYVNGHAMPVVVVDRNAEQAAIALARKPPVDVDLIGYFGTQEFQVPYQFLNPGQPNVLAIRIQSPANLDDGHVVTDAVPDMPVFVTVPVSDGQHPDTRSLGGGPLPNAGSLVARRPSNEHPAPTRQFWQHAAFSATGAGLGAQGPGFWGIFRDLYEPDYHVYAGGGAQRMGGPDWGWVPHAPGGFAQGVTWSNSDWGFHLGDGGWSATIGRYPEPSFGAYGDTYLYGGGSVTMSPIRLTSSDERGPGISYLFSYGISGPNATRERTVFNQIISAGNAPVDARPWANGIVVATIPLTQTPIEILTSVASSAPLSDTLGMARMYVQWLDADQVVRGVVAADEFGVETQPATLYPLSENMMWTATQNGHATGDWTQAKYLQIVMFRHHETPNQGNDWDVSIVVREKAPTVTTSYAYWA